MHRNGRPGHELLERHLEPVPADDGRMNPARDLPKLLEGGRDLPSGLIEPRAQLGVARHRGLEQAELERKGDESLLSAVVQVALESLPLLLPGLDHPRPRSAQLLEAGAKLGMQPRVLERDPCRGAHGIEELRLVEQRRVVNQRRDLLPLAFDHRRRSDVTCCGSSTARPSRSAQLSNWGSQYARVKRRVAKRSRERVAQICGADRPELDEEIADRRTRQAGIERER